MKSRTLFEAFLSGQTFTSAGEIMDLIAPAGWFLVGFSLIELKLAYRLPERQKGAGAMQFDWSAYRSGRYLTENLGAAYGNRVIWLSIVGLSVFWAISQVMV